MVWVLTFLGFPLFQLVLSRWKLSSEASIAPDNDVFKHLAEVYSFNHLTMHKGLPCPDGSVESFVNGTTNGAKWYPLPGKLVKP